jgi:hypothetical protein
MELYSPVFPLQSVRTHPRRRDARMPVAGRNTRCACGKRARGDHGGDAPLEGVCKKGAAWEVADEARWKRGEEEWLLWAGGRDEEEEDDDARTGCQSDKEMCAACEEACSDAEDAEEDEASSRPITVKVLVKDGTRVAVLDSACYSIWVDKKAFGKMGGYEYDEGGSAWSADGSHCEHCIAHGGSGKAGLLLMGAVVP